MSIQNLNDLELVQLYVGGNESALATLLERHKRKIFTSIIMVVKDQQLAEDIFQDAFYKVIITLKRTVQRRRQVFTLGYPHCQKFDH